MAQGKDDKPAVNNSVPYPEAPLVSHSDLDQEHYRGARDPALAPKRERETRQESRQPPYRRPFTSEKDEG